MKIVDIVRWSPLLVLPLLLAACAEDATPAFEVPEGCNPLAPEWDCLLPFPFDGFREPDPTLPGGARVVLPPVARVDTTMGPVDFGAHRPADGFSPGTPILVRIPEGVDPSELVSYADAVARSTGPDSPTLILEADTGAPVLHFAELDPLAPADRRALILRPLVRLRDAARYIVALRDLHHPDGTAVEAPLGFRELRDGTGTDDAEMLALAARFEAEVFPVLETAGVSRDGLVLAWDFTTRTEQNATGDMLAVRDDALAFLGEGPPVVTVTEVQDDVDEHIARRLDLTVRLPLYLESTELGARLHRDGDGAVARNGVVEVPFTVLVPRSVAARVAGDPPARLLQFGHGFFGSREEAADSDVAGLADERSFVVVAADWWGMSRPDRDDVAQTILDDPADVASFTDRVHQAMASFVIVARAAMGPVAELPALRDAAGPVYDPSRIFYLGISQGHILGGTYLALSPDVERGVLNVGGANFSLIMFRSGAFVPFLIVIHAVVDDFLERQKVAALLQLSLDRIDPLTYAPHVITTPYAGAPAERRVLLQVGLGDQAVPTLAAHLHARAMGAVHLQPAPRALPALPTASSPVDGSAIVEHDFGVEEVIEASAPRANDVHEGVRRLGVVREQIDRFLRADGQIEHTCDGPCDPE